MNKILFFVIFLFMSTNSLHSQIQKRNTVIGGNASLNLGLDEESGTSFFLSPTYGKFFTDKLLVSAGVGFSFFDNEVSNNWSFNVGPILRYYINVNDKLSPFLTGGVNYSYQRFDSDFLEDFSGFRTFVGGGLSVHLNKHITLDGMAIYVYDEFRESNDIRLRWGFSIYLDSGEE